MSRPFPPPSFLPGPDVHSLAALLVGAIEPTYLYGTDTAELVANARRHAVAPMLYWRLDQTGVNLKTSEWPTLRLTHQKQVRADLRRKLAFTGLEAAFRSGNIPTVWLKGFAQAHGARSFQGTGCSPRPSAWRCHVPNHRTVARCDGMRPGRMAVRLPKCLENSPCSFLDRHARARTLDPLLVTG